MALDTSLFLLGLNVNTTATAPVPFTPVVIGAVAWYDPSDITTLFQDTAGTTPVTTAGQSVARINDKSGNGRNLTQATAGSRPTYQVDGGGFAYLSFDGVDDNLGVNDAGLRIVGDLTLCAAAYKNAVGSFGGLMTCQTNAASVNAYEFRYSNANPLTMTLVDGGASVESKTATGATSAAAAHVVSARRVVATSIELSTDKVRESLALTLTPTADASSKFVMGDRNATGIPLAGRVYQASVYASNLSTANLALLETHHGAKAGLTL